MWTWSLVRKSRGSLSLCRVVVWNLIPAILHPGTEDHGGSLAAWCECSPSKHLLLFYSGDRGLPSSTLSCLWHPVKESIPIRREQAKVKGVSQGGVFLNKATGKPASEVSVKEVLTLLVHTVAMGKDRVGEDCPVCGNVTRAWTHCEDNCSHRAGSEDRYTSVVWELRASPQRPWR